MYNAPDDCEILDNGCPADFDVHKLLPHEEYCHIYYQCDNGEKVLRYCAKGTYFNPIKEICDWPENVDCVNDGSYEYPSTSAPVATDRPTTKPWDALENGCPADFEIHHLLPHESECNKFYQCVFGQKLETACAPGTYFNFEIQTCDWPENVDCESSGGGGGPPTPGVPESSEELPNPGDNDGSDWEPLPNGCPADFDIHHHLPHESDCNKFYQCAHGQKVETVCPAGLHFNPTKQVCDWPRDAGCEHWEGPGCPTPNPDGDCTSTATSVTQDPPTQDPVTADPSTPAPVTQDPSTPAPVTQDPSTPAPVTQDPSTPAPVTQDPSTPAPVTQDPSTPPPVTQDPSTPAPVTQDPSTPAPVTQDPSTPAPVTQDPSTPAPETPDPSTPSPVTPDPSTPAPITPTLAPVTTTTQDPDDCEILDNGCPADFDVHKLLPHEEYCHKFYQCVHGEKVLRYCAKGTYFNPEIENCDWPENVDCVNDGSYEYPSTSVPVVTDKPTTPPWDPLENGCPADFDIHHLLPHETECNKFYQCVFGQKLETACAPGTYFNFEIQVCDWPENVDCESSGGGNPTPGVPDSSDELPNPGDNGGSDWEPLPNGCPADFDIHHLLPHESDCNKFYYCVRGETVETECPPGLHFNPTEQICDWPRDAGCEHWEGPGCPTPNPDGGCTSTTTPVTEDPPTPPPSPVTQETPTEGTTTEEITTTTEDTICDTEDTPSTEDTTTATQSTTPSSEDTTTTTQSTTTTTQSTTPSSEDTTTTTQSTTPSIEDTTTTTQSSTPSIEDTTTTTQSTTPSIEDTTTTTQSSTPSIEDTTTTTQSSTPPTDTTTTQGTTTPGGDCEGCPIIPEDKCKDECNVAPWAHEDCDKFWICNGDQPLLVTCSEGLYFNPTTYTCDFNCNVPCVRSSIQATADYHGVKVFLPWSEVDENMMKALKIEL